MLHQLTSGIIQFKKIKAGDPEPFMVLAFSGDITL